MPQIWDKQIGQWLCLSHGLMWDFPRILFSHLLNGKNFKAYLCCVTVLPACVSVHHVCAWYLKRPEECVRTSIIAMQVQGIESSSFERAASDLNGCTISPAHEDLKPIHSFHCCWGQMVDVISKGRLDCWVNRAKTSERQGSGCLQETSRLAGTVPASSSSFCNPEIFWDTTVPA